MWRKKKAEWKQDIYNIKVCTFRRTLQLIVWWWKEYFDENFWDTWLKYEENNWLYKLDSNNNCNIIWLAKYDLSVLVHELMHCVLWMLEQVWEYAEWETPAYMYEELFTKIWIQCWDKFKIDKYTKEYFSK